jgi:hypothetical protein
MAEPHLPVRPLAGSGPWSLIEVADATGLPYETVYRDARLGRLPCTAVTVGRATRYAVTRDALARGVRPAYRRALPPPSLMAVH